MGFLRRLKFNLWYFRDPPWDTGVSPPELLAFIQNHPAGRALDLGCGTGTNVITLAQHGWDVTGIDFAAQAVRAARRKVQRAGVKVELRVDDVTRPMQSAQPFDLILDMGCFHNLSQAGRAAYIQNLVTLLAPGGTYLLYAHFKAIPGASGPGVEASDLEAIASHIPLIDRKDGAEKSGRPSAWFTHQKL